MSATDEERLPPGGFSLRDIGVEGWFGRSADIKRTRGANNLQTPARGIDSPRSVPSSSAASPLRSGGTTRDTQPRANISTYEVLRYIRSTFDDEKVLDKIPLSAAGNPGAWHAWRSKRVKEGAISDEKATWHEGLSDDDSAPEGYSRLAGGTSSPKMARRPGEWNWEGVWEVRVKKGLEASVSESILYGKEAGDDLIRFLNMDDKDVAGIKEEIEKSLETEEVQRRGVV